MKKLLGNKHTVDPRVINVDKSPTFPPALSELQSENVVPKKTKLRAINYLNNSMGKIINLPNPILAIGNGINLFRLQQTH